MSKLSRRQAEIVTRLASGESQKAIARELRISYSTVRNHMRQARERTDCRTSLELAIKAQSELRRVPN